jgi:hypothetical protein
MADLKVVDYKGFPQRMLLVLVDMAEGNPKLRRMWQANYLRLTDEKREVRV